MASFVVAEFAGSRELVDKARAEALVKEVVESVGDGKPSKIRLSNKSFNVEAAVVVRDYLRTLTDVRVADISDIIAGRPTEEALETLVTICSGLKDFPLVEVDVSDNALGPRGIESCRDVLCQKTLEKVYLCNNGLSAESCEMVRDVLLADGCPAIKLLHFYNNMSGNGGAEAVSTIVKALAGTLVDFRYSATRGSAAGCEALAQAIGTCASLTSIDLSDNTFGDSAAATLAESLKRQKGLRRLCLRDDAFGEEGTMAIINALKEGNCFQELTFLDLSGSEINEEMMEELCVALLKLPKLQELLLDDNEFGTDGCTVLAGALRQLSCLIKLSVCSCEITANGALAIAKAVASLTSFNKLELNGNEVCETGVEKITAVLGKAGKHLGDMEDNDEDAEDDLEEENDEGEEGEEAEEANNKAATADDADLKDIEASLSAVKIEDSK